MYDPERMTADELKEQEKFASKHIDLYRKQTDDRKHCHPPVLPPTVMIRFQNNRLSIELCKNTHVPVEKAHKCNSVNKDLTFLKEYNDHNSLLERYIFFVFFSSSDISWRFLKSKRWGHGRWFVVCDRTKILASCARSSTNVRDVGVCRC